MRKVHLISVTEPLVLDLALAIHEKGYEVSVSGDGMTEEVIAKLHTAGCTCHGNGWFPERLTKDNNFVVLGATVKQDNPELINEDAFKNWIIKVKLSDKSELDNLLTPEQYQNICK